MKVTVNNSQNDEVELRYGDLLQWIGVNNNNICMYMYSGIVSLNNPKNIWTIMSIAECLNKGSLVKLPKGFSITLTQE